LYGAIVKDLAYKHRRTVVLVMHDLNLAARFSNKLVLLKDGCVFAAGGAKKVLTAENISVVYGVEASVTDGKFGMQVLPLRSIVGQKTALARK
jgi:iron complex transport system ATP-binding protein